jgi:hypothetical protein
MRMTSIPVPRSAEYKQFLLDEQLAEAKQQADAAAKKQQQFLEANGDKISTLLSIASAVEAAESKTAFAAPSPRFAKECKPAKDSTTAESVKTAFEQARASLKAKGVVLNDGGIRKIVTFADINPGVDWSDPESFILAHYWLAKHQLYEDGDGERVPVVTPVAEPKPSVEDIERMELSGLENDRKAKQLIQAEFSDEQQKVWQAFTDSLYKAFNGFMLTQEQSLYIYNLMRRRGYSFLNPVDYDSARVQAVRDKVIPESILYPQEALDLYIERNDVNDPEVKHQIVVRQRVINQDALRARHIFGR